MRVLWFEVSEPARYSQNKLPIAGWQDSLETIVYERGETELGIAFQSQNFHEKKIIDGITYFPITLKLNFIEKIKNKYTWDVSKVKLLQQAVKVIEEFKPDIIQVFGSEWCWGQVAKYVDIPVVVHMQGSIPPYYNARFPPSYSDECVTKKFRFNPKKRLGFWLQKKKYLSWKKQEEETLKVVSNFMGRTDWDQSLISVFNPKAKYFYCSEALRKNFYESSGQWRPLNKKKLLLFSTGCSTYWKGPDMLLKTALVLKNMGIDFEWWVAGKITIKNDVEIHEKIKFDDVNVLFLGFLNPSELKDYLLKSDIYVHTAYIENSPNSICEAQLLGMPVISTNVGGISSLIENGVDGILVPANDPYYMAAKIKMLGDNVNLQQHLSRNAYEKARCRHNEKVIYDCLKLCYKTIMENRKC